ncbi:CsxC family protein [Niallia oryzisoli]|uniref:CsxC family protein n=1 Tax=Niallia oryzisoli TaxID=1737571 RepID=UPI0037359062
MSDYKKHNHDCDEHCDCEKNKHHYPHVSIGKIVTKVPVVLAELDLQVDKTHVTIFQEPVLEIKDIKKRLVITQCRLLLPTNKLFIKGYIRKNIQYATPISGAGTGPVVTNTGVPQQENPSIQSSILSQTEQIPFEVITEVKDFISSPVMPEKNKRQEFDFFVSQPLPMGYPEKDEMLSSDLSQFHQESSQHYNELPYCELLSSKIIEWDEAIDREGDLFSNELLDEGTFTRSESKMVIYFKVKILQNQQIRVSSTTNDHDWDHDCD